jgi:acid phosphatase
MPTSPNLTCVAPLETIPPLNLTLLAVYLFTRHGSRTPTENWTFHRDPQNWTCDSSDARSPRTFSLNFPNQNRRFRLFFDESIVPFTTNCDLGTLTLNGMIEHEELGQFYRHKLVDSLHLLPDLFDSDLVSLRSSSTDRCVRSLISFVNGMYPPAFIDELLTVQTGAERESLRPGLDLCDDLLTDTVAFMSSAEYSRRAANAKVVQKPLYDYLNLTWDGINWQYIGDFLVTETCSGHSIPPVATDEMLETAVNDTAFWGAGFYATCPHDGVGPIWRVLIKEIDELLSGNVRTRFWLNSGHDITITTILVALGYVDLRGWPPFRSHLAVELYDGDPPVLRFVYNGKVLRVKGEEVISLPRFKVKVVDSLSRCLD